MNDFSDPYWRLRPSKPTPPDELCRCSPRPPIVLVHHLTDNPLHCFECNLEVPPEQLGLSGVTAERLSHWNWLDSALYGLWLDSEEYEDWALERLTDPNGRVNQLAADLVTELNSHVRTYHWWFVDLDTQLQDCPRCRKRLEPKPTKVHQRRKVCEACSTAVTDYPNQKPWAAG